MARKAQSGPEGRQSHRLIGHGGPHGIRARGQVHGTGPVGHRDLERLAHRDGRGLRNEARRPLRDRCEEAVVIDDLVREVGLTPLGRLPRDRQHRYTIEHRVRNAVHQ